ncbi:transcription antitermination factor NusB [Thiospirochaeta perfilievii]|uniref:Transcription antitermination protein NusB n=1 Tax=Thiospirochaeta perfilievii TaxID=252967 RepID=A0A5C1QFG0_9SPIO|nr:transcription antitermination factor NusB [Thiospirochaeta perfilievii]QEN05860.1 transcription antitermination factor NusB [Thiospirochaeta perfilievii]
MEPRHKGRELAFKALYSWELNKSTIFADITNIDNESSPFGEDLFTGVIGNIEYIDQILSKNLVNWHINRINKIDLSILRLSIYSLIFLKDIPKVITINEAINISKDYGTDQSYKFVNGILDSINI